jgi:hypothetical protein
MKKTEIKAALALLQSASNATETALAAVADFAAKRERVSTLRRLTVEANADSEAEAAAAELVPLAEQVRILELTTERRAAAIERAKADQKRVGLEILQDLEPKAEALDNAATVAGFDLLRSFLDPECAAIGNDTHGGAQREHGLGITCRNLLGVHTSTELLQTIRAGIQSEASASYAQETLERWEATEARIRASIAKLEAATLS